MKEAGYGRIVNITSSAGLRGNFGQTNYGAAKAAIMGMTFVWALELGRYGITVNAVSPAGFTRMTEGLYRGAEPPPDQDPALNAPLVAFLASEGAAYVNGQVLGRTGFAYTMFQTPRQVAAMWREGGWTPQPGGRPLPRRPGPAPPAGGHAGPPPLGQEGLGRVEAEKPRPLGSGGRHSAGAGVPPRIPGRQRMMDIRDKIYIGGAWVPSTGTGIHEVFDSNTEEVIGKIPEGTADDVERAVAAAAEAFPAWAATSVEERAKLLDRIAEGLGATQRRDRRHDLAARWACRSPCPGRSRWGCRPRPSPTPPSRSGRSSGRRRSATPWWCASPSGVVGAITPWNYPLYQIALKVAPAMAVGLHGRPQAQRGGAAQRLRPGRGDRRGRAAAGRLQPGVGLGRDRGRGHRLAPRRSTWSRSPAPPGPASGSWSWPSQTVKKVALELGGKSANVIFEDADLDAAIPAGIFACYLNSGQTCSALTRMIVPRSRLAEVEEKAAAAAAELPAGRRLRRRAPCSGPSVSAAQRDRVRGYIQKGIDEGAKLVTGGPEPPEGLEKGYFVQPDRLLGGHHGHDDRPGGDLRPGALHPPLRHRGGGDPHRQRLRLRPGRGGVGGRQGARRGGGPPAPHRAGRRQRRARSTPRPRSAATSSRAWGASAAASGSRSSCRSSRSSADAPRPRGVAGGRSSASHRHDVDQRLESGQSCQVAGGQGCVVGHGGGGDQKVHAP